MKIPDPYLLAAWLAGWLAPPVLHGFTVCTVAALLEKRKRLGVCFIILYHIMLYCAVPCCTAVLCCVSLPDFFPVGRK